MAQMRKEHMILAYSLMGELAGRDNFRARLCEDADFVFLQENQTGDCGENRLP